MTNQQKITDWAMKHGLIQCAGCKGYDKAEHITYHFNRHYGTAFPYCTTECKEADQQ